MTSVSRRVFLAAAALSLSSVAPAQDDTRYLFNDVAVWDGMADSLQPSMNVLI